MGKISKRFPLGKRIEFTDGCLKVSVGRKFAYVSWDPKGVGNHEVIYWRISSMYDPFRIIVDVEDKDHKFDNKAENIMNYRRLFEGVHKHIDTLLDLYDKGYYYTPQDFYEFIGSLSTNLSSRLMGEN